MYLVLKYFYFHSNKFFSKQSVTQRLLALQWVTTSNSVVRNGDQVNMPGNMMYVNISQLSNVEFICHL